MADILEKYIRRSTAERNVQYHVAIVGRVEDKEFHIAELSAKLLETYKPQDIAVNAVPLCEADWCVFLAHCKKMVGGTMWSIKSETVVFCNGEFLGDAFELLDWLKKVFGYEEYRPMPLYDAITTLETRKFFTEKERTHVFMAISVGDEALSGRLIFQLFDDICPRTVLNFRNLCTSTVIGESYTETVFHRVVKSGWMQGGDIVDGSGGNSVSSFGTEFDDECFEVKHSGRGVLGMANTGRNTNGSQFYVTFQPCHWMDKKHVAFGRLVTGWDLLAKLEAVEVFNDRPITTCRIVSCGEWTPR
ncbi:uncharacterized protein LOC135804540 [Sycon ciliatum]|uniref:uncharacterized protein LOC135804540 n=1 Tax=Sycon ciliatum TaxID=27933 RepID=UPI0020A98216|eukprot:scpid39244/ scgid22051/ Peptidyl-prolyl cis-trans isomerase-like 6; Cyclophilin-like protein PPIL6; Rotamase PPIL6